MATSDFSLKNHNVKAFGQDAALVIEMNNEDVSSSKPSPFSNEIDNYYLTLHAAPRNAKKDYDWGSNRSVLLKLSTNEVMQMGNDSNLLIVFYVQIMPDDLVMQLHRF
ncbi:hypothetical protein ACBD82_003597 [Salmonella enterica]